MQVSQPNDCKVYSLNAGKILPDWLPERKRRKLLKKDVELQHRLELLQDFSMPFISNCIRLTNDLQSIMVTGTYKPRIRCYDFRDMSLKYDRCFDEEVVKFLPLEDDCRKAVFMHCDRSIEFHVAYGKLFRTRIPKPGRDFDLHHPTADLYIVAAGSEVYRLNLELGQFLAPITTLSKEALCCKFNEYHYLFSCGTKEGLVECYDPRVRRRVGVLDVGAAVASYSDGDVTCIPSVTTLHYKNALTLGVGTSTGHVLLYDLRTDKPSIVKDHMNEEPIKAIRFQDSEDIVLSCDKTVLKLWKEDTGKLVTFVQPDTHINDLCIYPDSGMIFMATEAPRILNYFIPTLGPAPRWCAFLETLTEELEETYTPSVFEDYQFVTRSELESLSLSHLIGTNLLRASMHGFFLNARLYKKAKSLADPGAFEQNKQAIVREKIESERVLRLPERKKLPKINRALAERLMAQEEQLDLANVNSKILEKTKAAQSILKDERFASLFEDPSLQVDEHSEEYLRIYPVLSSIARKRQDRVNHGADVNEAIGSSDDEIEFTSDMVKTMRAARREREKREIAEVEEVQRKAVLHKPEHSVEKRKDAHVQEADGEDYLARKSGNNKLLKMSLGERLRQTVKEHSSHVAGNLGEREMTFTVHKRINEKKQKELQEHNEERKKVRRSAGHVQKKIHRPFRFR